MTKCKHKKQTGNPSTVAYGKGIKQVAQQTITSQIYPMSKPENEIQLSAPTAHALKLVMDNRTEESYIEGMEETARLIVSDLHCKVLIKQIVTNQELVSISSLQKGIYIAKIITATGIVEKKLVKA